jgi:hypothetical protein
VPIRILRLVKLDPLIPCHFICSHILKFKLINKSFLVFKYELNHLSGIYVLLKVCRSEKVDKILDEGLVWVDNKTLVPSPVTYVTSVIIKA